MKQAYVYPAGDSAATESLADCGRPVEHLFGERLANGPPGREPPE